MKQKIKKILFGEGNQIKKILFGKAKGITMYIDLQNKIQRIMGTDEREIQSSFVRFAKKSGYFFDIGASDAYYGLFYKKYNPTGQAYLFDADKKFEQIQKENFDINHFSEGIHLYQKYVSNVDSDSTISIDSFGIEGKNVFIKIDVEGAETAVLQGVQNMLKANNCCLIIETHSFQLEKDCVSFLENLGYKTHIIKNAWWRVFIPELRPLEHNRWLEAFK
ncbi:MAG TPA: FkbM family methyltransferase [Puia sp.]|nr:FkbM family methyltransferase [Puia sp.]